MKQRVYIDTSVFGGYFDEEFSEHTIPLFKRLNEGEFIILFSNVTEEELEKAPEKVKTLVKELKANNTEFWKPMTRPLIWRQNIFPKKLLDKLVFPIVYTLLWRQLIKLTF
jgi:hypothetical protein